MSTLKIPVSTQDHIQGNAKAACTLIEYGDYQCPNCGEAYPLVKEIQAHFGKRLRFVFRNFPMTKIHAHAQSAAEVAEFAASLGQFWEMHDLLFENQRNLGDDLFAQLGAGLGIDVSQLQQALANKTFADRVRADFTGGVRSGVNGTPTFFINNQRYDDPMDYPTMVQAIEKALSS
jgi:protein-disulfide isomerase